MDIISLGLNIAQGILNIIQQATGSRGVGIALGIVGTIAGAFGGLQGGGAPVAAAGPLAGATPAIEQQAGARPVPGVIGQPLQGAIATGLPGAGPQGA